MNSTFFKGLIFLVSLTLIPMTLVASLFLGQTEVSSALVNGTIAYAWMLTALYISSKPAWLKSFIGSQSAMGVQTSLILASLPLIWQHQASSPATGLVALTGVWAMVALLASLIYAGLIALTTVIKLPAVNPTMTKWAARLNLMATLATFAHAHVFASSQNLVFMALLYLLTGFVVFSYLIKPTEQAEAIAQSVN